MTNSGQLGKDDNKQLDEDGLGEDTLDDKSREPSRGLSFEATDGNTHLGRGEDIPDGKSLDTVRGLSFDAAIARGPAAAAEEGVVAVSLDGTAFEGLVADTVFEIKREIQKRGGGHAVTQIINAGEGAKFGKELGNNEALPSDCTHFYVTFDQSLTVEDLMEKYRTTMKPLRDGRSVYDPSISPLWLAAGFGHYDVASLLLETEKGIAHMHTNRNMHIATINGHFSLVRLLIENGADVNATLCYLPPGARRDPLLRQWRTPLDEALLLARGKAWHYNATSDKRELRTLSTAAKKNFIDIARLLLENGGIRRMSWTHWMTWLPNGLNTRTTERLLNKLEEEVLEEESRDVER